jgi:uncharacterized cupredoxin-like copper-binding protein
MTNLPTRAHTSMTTLVAAVVLLSACSFGSADSSTEVTGTNQACIIASTELAAGKIDFEFTNEADDVSELYVLRASGDVVGEVENVTTGTSRTLTVDLDAGDYLVRCKPGQTGTGISAPFTVTGEGGTAEAVADRTVTFASVDFAYTDLDLTGISVGDTIRFEMTNDGSQPHEFEVLDPSGEAVGEVEAIEAGTTGAATVVFEAAGTYEFQCILIDPASGKEHTLLGMSGTFEVAGT